MEKFVYLLEEEAVAALLPDWPREMQLALCLGPDGGCEMAVHHRAEVAQALGRIAALNDPAGRQDRGVAKGRDEDAADSQFICVAPPVAGYPTRKVLFSEEQQLLSLVAGMPQLAEMASDYAINHRFARDQGLDLATLTAGANRDAGPAPATPRDHGRAPAPDGAVPTPKAAALHFVTHLSLPAGYAAPAAAERPECLFVEGRLECAGTAIRLTVAPQAASGTELPVAVAKLGYRDDFARFVLPRTLLGQWAPGRAALLDIPADLFPEALAARYMARPHLAEITVTRRGVFVTPGAPLKADAGAGQPPRAARRPLLQPVHGAVAALVVVLLVSGHFATALDRGTGGGSAPGGGADAALDLIAAMAAEADRTR